MARESEDGEYVFVNGHMRFKRSEYEAFEDGRMGFRNGFRDTNDGRMGRQPDFIPYEDADDSYGASPVTPAWDPDNGEGKTERDNDEGLLDDETLEAAAVVAVALLAALAVKLDEILQRPETQEHIHQIIDRLGRLWKNTATTMKERATAARDWVVGRGQQVRDLFKQKEKETQEAAQEDEQIATAVITTALATCPSEHETIQDGNQAIGDGTGETNTTAIVMNRREFNALSARFTELLGQYDEQTRELLFLWHLLSNAQVKDDVQAIKERYADAITANDDVRQLFDRAQSGTLPSFDAVLRDAMKATGARIQIEKGPQEKGV